MHIRKPTACESLRNTSYAQAHRRLFEQRLDKVLKLVHSQGSIPFPEAAKAPLRAAVNMSRCWAETVVYMEQHLDRMDMIGPEVEVWMIVDERTKETQKV